MQSVKLMLIDNFKYEFLELVFNSSKCLHYRIFKTELVFELLHCAILEPLTISYRLSMADFFFFFLGGGGGGGR